MYNNLKFMIERDDGEGIYSGRKTARAEMVEAVRRRVDRCALERLDEAK